MNERILLLGANGLLGKIFAAEFQRRGIAAECLGRAGCDVTSAPSVSAVVARVAPSIVINCTAYTKVDLAEKERDQAMAANGSALANIATACREHGARLVHFSTDFVFNGRSTVPYVPTDAVAPLSVYGESKLEGEKRIREIDPPGWMIARTSWLYGVTGPCFPKLILDRATKGDPLKIVNDQVGSPTYAPDLANAIFGLLEKQATGIHHLTNSGQCSWFEFAKAIAAEFQLKADITPISTAQFLQMRPQQAIRPAYSVMTDPAIHKLLGREIQSWQEGLRDFRLQFSAA
jgi:dTDP-4-dehydrorhamnose reductase